MMAHLSPSNIFARIETLRKWQEEQQLRLLKQQQDQNAFLSGAQRRLHDAFEKQTDEVIPDTPTSTPKALTLTLDFVDTPETTMDTSDISDQPIATPKKDFNELLEEKLKIEHVIVKANDETNDRKPKKPFLKKGTGLSRFGLCPMVKNMHKPPSKHLKIFPEKPVAQKVVEKKTVEIKPEMENICRGSWAAVLDQGPLSTLQTPIQDQSIEQHAFEKQLEREMFMKRDLDELRVFELLEQKALNSSFCSTSSMVARLLGPMCTPVVPCPSVNRVRFKENDQLETHVENFKDETTWMSDDEETSSESSSLSSSTVQSLCSLTPITRDVATNTEAQSLDTELLKTRLEQLENEIETFRGENNRVSKIKCALEKERSKMQKESEEQKVQLEEDRKKLQKDKTLFDKYMKELRNKPSKREREEISALQSQLNATQEELKLKESRYGASQARQRNQLRTLEKENAALRTENDSLKKQNAKLQAAQQKLEKRRPSDTKVLHEINKNLTKLALETKKTKPTTETSTKDDDKENALMSESNYFPSEAIGRKDVSIDPSFESIERDYNRIFGTDVQIPQPKRMDTSVEDSHRKADREETVLADGSCQITYSNGNVKMISPDSNTVTMTYFNGDVKETRQESGTIRYYYSEADTWHTTYAADGLEVLEFPNGQVEKRHKDGNSEISFPDGCVRCTSPSGTEKVTFPDGTVVITDAQGGKVLTLPNGQKEVHTKEHKRREYPDGTIKVLYPDGMQETRYANGRIRLKDQTGQLIMDTASGMG